MHVCRQCGAEGEQKFYPQWRKPGKVRQPCKQCRALNRKARLEDEATLSAAYALADEWEPDVSTTDLDLY